jgi:hypothetical protein
MPNAANYHAVVPERYNSLLNERCAERKVAYGRLSLNASIGTDAPDTPGADSSATHYRNRVG